jgi:hypothetical protein
MASAYLTSRMFGSVAGKGGIVLTGASHWVSPCFSPASSFSKSWDFGPLFSILDSGSGGSTGSLINELHTVGSRRVSGQRDQGCVTTGFIHLR